jgi:hypothetical protein
MLGQTLSSAPRSVVSQHARVLGPAEVEMPSAKICVAWIAVRFLRSQIAKKAMDSSAKGGCVASAGIGGNGKSDLRARSF